MAKMDVPWKQVARMNGSDGMCHGLVTWHWHARDVHAPVFNRTDERIPASILASISYSELDRQETAMHSIYFHYHTIFFKRLERALLSHSDANLFGIALYRMALQYTIYYGRSKGTTRFIHFLPQK
jgi:hypothetical protein